MPEFHYRLGTRGSLLARSQSQLVAQAIERAHPSVKIELVILKTTGDIVQDRPLAEMGGKGLFTKELELALLHNEIDLAVHSYKDVPVTMPLVDSTELTIACVPSREDPRDCLISRSSEFPTIESLPRHARVGTGSLRRKCQLMAIRPDLQVMPIRGNIDTRLNRLADGDYDAIVLAVAGLSRSGLMPKCHHSTILPVAQMVPAAGQGALAIQTHRDNKRLIELLKAIHQPFVARCIDVERQVVRLLDGDCHSPIGVHVSPADSGDGITIRACVGEPGGNQPVRFACLNRGIEGILTVAEEIITVLQNARK